MQGYSRSDDPSRALHSCPLCQLPHSGSHSPVGSGSAGGALRASCCWMACSMRLPLGGSARGCGLSTPTGTGVMNAPPPLLLGTGLAAGGATAAANNGSRGRQDSFLGYPYDWGHKYFGVFTGKTAAAPRLGPSSSWRRGWLGCD